MGNKISLAGPEEADGQIESAAAEREVPMLPLTTFDPRPFMDLVVHNVPPITRLMDEIIANVQPIQPLPFVFDQLSQEARQPFDLRLDIDRLNQQNRAQYFAQLPAEQPKFSVSPEILKLLREMPSRPPVIFSDVFERTGPIPRRWHEAWHQEQEAAQAQQAAAVQAEQEAAQAQQEQFEVGVPTRPRSP